MAITGLGQPENPWHNRDGNDGVAEEQRTFNAKITKAETTGYKGNLQRSQNPESTEVCRWGGEHRIQSIMRTGNRTIHVAGSQPTANQNQEQQLIFNKLVNTLAPMGQLFFLSLTMM